MTRYALVLLPLAALLPSTVAAQQSHRSARDTFWSASDLLAVTPNPAKHPAIPRTTKPRAPGADSDYGVVGELASNNGNRESEPAGRPNAAQLVSDNGYGAAPHLVRTAENRLGLRYSVLLRGADGQYAEVRPGTTFHSGDHIRLSLMANQPGYLYVIEQGSSGSWSPIFPKPGAAADANRIEQGVVQQVPGKANFLFDQQPGEEKLFVILSLNPVADLDRRIEGLKSADTSNTPTASAGPMIEAENHIPDVFVQQLASRDLTLVDEEKVDEAATATHGSEKAVYVVSKVTDAPGTGSEVVASIKLDHQ